MTNLSRCSDSVNTFVVGRPFSVCACEFQREKLVALSVKVAQLGWKNLAKLATRGRGVARCKFSLDESDQQRQVEIAVRTSACMALLPRHHSLVNCQVQPVTSLLHLTARWS